jgi:multidrug efflux pump subunit AcrA (membrane-fusion protein)
MPLAVSACAKTPVAQARPAATVSVAPVKRANVPYLIEANGVVMPMQTAAVVPQVDGIILAVDFHEGDEVRAGQPLFRIDARPYENAYEQSLAVVARDSANDAHNKSEVDRYQKLLASKVSRHKRPRSVHGRRKGPDGPCRSRCQREVRPRQHRDSRRSRQDGLFARQAGQPRWPWRGSSS